LRLKEVFDGWQGYQSSLERAIAPLAQEQLAWRPLPGVRSLGEVIRHLSVGRITWLARINPPGIEEARSLIPEWYTDADGAHHAVESSGSADNSTVLAQWLKVSWAPIRQMLDQWTVQDLTETYIHRFQGTNYRVSRQWTVWRILSHDVHHGGQIAMMLAMQGVEAFELRALGGHIVEPPVAEQA
jgi:uncharacterized damage-inducible protein DinB